MKPGKIVNVDARKVKVKKRLAEGASGYVYEVKDQSSGQRFALKQVIVGDDDDDALNLCEQEIEIMRLLKGHANLVAFDSWRLKPRKNKKKPRQALVLMEFCPGGKLSEFLRSQQPLSEDDVLALFRQMAQGLAHMHSQQPPIVHRDLKAENILMAADGTVKICDMGSAMIGAYPDLDQTRGIMRAADDIQRVTTPSYRAPEMVDVHQFHRLDEKVDVWALACVLYLMMYRALPFGESGGMRALQGAYDVPKAPVFSKFLLKLLAAMFTVHPRDRPSIRAVLRALDRKDVPRTDARKGSDGARHTRTDPCEAKGGRAGTQAQSDAASDVHVDASQLSSLNTIRVTPAELANWPPRCNPAEVPGVATDQSVEFPGKAMGGGLDGWMRRDAASSSQSSHASASTVQMLSTTSSFEIDMTTSSVGIDMTSSTAGPGLPTSSLDVTPRDVWQSFDSGSPMHPRPSGMLAASPGQPTSAVCQQQTHRRLGSSPASLEPYQTFSYPVPSPPGSLNMLNPFNDLSRMSSHASDPQLSARSSTSSLAAPSPPGSIKSLNPFQPPPGHSRQGSSETVVCHASPPSSIELLGPLFPPSAADTANPFDSSNPFPQ